MTMPRAERPRDRGGVRGSCLTRTVPVGGFDRRAYGAARGVAADPEDLEAEEEDERDTVSCGIHEIPRRRDSDIAGGDGGGYVRRGELPASMWARTLANVLPSPPHHLRRPSAFFFFGFGGGPSYAS